MGDGHFSGVVTSGTEERRVRYFGGPNKRGKCGESGVAGGAQIRSAAKDFGRDILRHLTTIWRRQWQSCRIRW